jgi:hypothetical protein
MPTEPFIQNYVQVFAGVRICLEKRLLMPALVLIYTLMDTFAWATSDKKPQEGRARFEAWCNRWLLPQGRLECTATELYAARCGVLHTLTATADLTTTGKAREVSYAWGTAKREDLNASITANGLTDVVGVHIDELFGSVSGAIANIMEASKTDAVLRARLEEAAELHFESMSKETVAAFKERVHGKSSV